ncbi:HAD family hydrolase [Candidatus Pacearchaeota archaeon]|nr:HAD family hydrolase [Candidatus Pacearchaeota archaeon]
MKAIVFDFDGVIADTYDFNMGLVKEVGHNVSDEDFKAHHDCNCLEKPKIAFTGESYNNFLKKYLERITRVKSFFTLENIQAIKKISSLYIISSTKEQSIKKFLDYNNLSYFDAILGYDFHKSKVEKFKYLLKKYNLKPDEVVFVTDTLGDILEANKVNVKTIAVDYGFHDLNRLKRGSPFEIVSNFDELLKVIKNM